jgi:voltage-gated potassium channel
MTYNQTNMRLPKLLQKTLYIKELVFLALALCSIIFLFIDLIEVLPPELTEAIFVFDVTVGSLFILEFFIELYFAAEKRHYVMHNWYYFVAAIPLTEGAYQFFQIIRIVRIVKVFRFGVGYIYGKRKLRQHISK